MFSLVLRNAARSARPSFTPVVVSVSVRGYGDGSNMHGNDPDVIEKEMQRKKDGTEHHTSTPHEHAPGWNEHLASVSEAHVKADKSSASPEEMQQSTVAYVKARHPEEVESGGSEFHEGGKK